MVNWIKWTTTGWRRLSEALRSGHREYEAAETARLIDGVEQLHLVDNVQSTPILQAPNDSKCPCCAGSRCWSWRQSKHTSGCGGHDENEKCWRSDEDGERLDGCGGDPEPIPVGVAFRVLMDRTILNPGRHSLHYVVRHWVHWAWNPLALRTRVRLAPNAWARRLGRPVQLGSFNRMALP